MPRKKISKAKIAPQSKIPAPNNLSNFIELNCAAAYHQGDEHILHDDTNHRNSINSFKRTQKWRDLNHAKYLHDKKFDDTIPPKSAKHSVKHDHNKIDEYFNVIPQLYTELESLGFHGNEQEISQLELYEWKIKSRWIKYEQSVDTATSEWSSPYVGPIVYQELVNLRHMLMTGSVFLHCQQANIEDVCDEVLGDMVNRGQLNQSHEQKLKDLILSRYRSQRAFAGVLTGRDNMRPDNLKATYGNSRLITVRTLAHNLRSMPTIGHLVVEEDGSRVTGEECADGDSKASQEQRDSHIFFIEDEKEDEEDSGDESADSTLNEASVRFGPAVEQKPTNTALNNSPKGMSNAFNSSRDTQRNFNIRLTNLKNRYASQNKVVNKAFFF